MIRLAALLIWLAGAAVAQEAVTVTSAEVREGRGGVALELDLSAITPYRVFTLDEPRRLVLDVAGLSLQEFDAEVLTTATAISDARAGPLRPGWVRLVLVLVEPLAIETAGLVRDGDGAVLTVALTPVTAERFAETAGAPIDPEWGDAAQYDPAAEPDAGDFVIVIDAAHGGALDEGHVVGGLRESDLALIMAQELAVRLRGMEGVHATLTRNDDRFLPIAERLRFASAEEADLLLSLLAYEGEPSIRGAYVWSFADKGDLALMGQLMDGDLGPDAAPSVPETGVSAVLGDLARAETLPASRRVADGFAASLARGGVVMRDPARGEGPWPILAAGRFPSVVLALGNMANAEDRAFLASPDGRNAIAAAIADTVELLAR